jgi:hypothetical protein
MDTQALAVFVALAFLTGGCGKSPAASNRDGQPPPQIQAEPFHGQVYRAIDGKTVLTLISKDECELAGEGRTLLCKYTKQNDTLRIIVTALGTSQVIYFAFTDQGLRDNDGNVLLSPKNYEAAMEQARLARERQENARREEERRQRQIDEQKRAEAEALHRKSLTMRDEMMADVRSFFTSGSVLKASYAAGATFIGHGDKFPFQVAVTGDVSFTNVKGDPYDQDFQVAGHMTWLGDPKQDHSFNNKGNGPYDKENDGYFIGQVIVLRDGDKRSKQVWVRYCVSDGYKPPNFYRSESSYFNGKEFVPGEKFGGDRYYRQ